MITGSLLSNLFIMLYLIDLVNFIFFFVGVEMDTALWIISKILAADFIK
jgi:hypothetical protein